MLARCLLLVCLLAALDLRTSRHPWFMNFRRSRRVVVKRSISSPGARVDSRAGRRRAIREYGDVSFDEGQNSQMPANG